MAERSLYCLYVCSENILRHEFKLDLRCPTISDLLYMRCVLLQPAFEENTSMEKTCGAKVKHGSANRYYHCLEW